jgi:prolyl oligopeptidase PreP (S9A serine peptidase family)
VEKLKEHTVSNIYLRNDKAKLSWQDVNSTLAFADYLQHQLEEQDITVVKRVLEFKKPVAAKKSKKTEETESINVS